MIESMMSLDDKTWEVKNPPHLRSPTEGDLFVEDRGISNDNRKKATLFYENFLQLKKREAEDAYPDMWTQANKENKQFSWQMMCLNLEDTRLLVTFFKDYVAADNKAVCNMLNKVEYFEEEEKVLSTLKLSNEEQKE